MGQGNICYWIIGKKEKKRQNNLVIWKQWAEVLAHSVHPIMESVTFSRSKTHVNFDCRLNSTACKCSFLQSHLADGRNKYSIRAGSEISWSNVGLPHDSGI